jgi:hypothetical protein
MNTGKAFGWAVCATLAALVSLVPPLHAAAQVDRASGVVGAAPSSQGSQQDEPPSVAATGVDPDGMTAAESSQPAEAAPQAETEQAGVERSGVLLGHAAAEDRPAAPTPAATGVGR